MQYDATDIKILTLLQENGRITNSKLAKETGISPPAMSERVKRLEASGVIDRYAAILDRQKAGFGLLAIINVSLSLHQISNLNTVKDQLVQLDEVLECYQMTGDIDFLLKVATKDMASYTDFVNARLSGIPGIQKLKTSFVLDTLKSATALTLSNSKQP
mgnify:CR=1 FL=1